MNTPSPSSGNSVTHLSMEAYRNAAFRAMVVARMHAGKATNQSPETIAARIAAEQRALAETLTDPSVIHVASEALIKAQASIHSNSRYQSTPARAHETMHQIFHRRAAEAHQFAQLLSKPEFINGLAAMLPAEVKSRVPSLHDVKMHEVLGDLLHLENGKPQVIAHIDATAKGAMLEHDALALVFAGNGTLHDAMMKGMAARLPLASQAEIHAVVGGWLAAREAAAKLTSDLSANDGAAYIEAVRRSTEWYRQPHENALTKTLPATTVEKDGLEIHTSARMLEKQKTANQRAEDIAYTINHALSCGTTDVFLQPAIAAAFGINVGCGDSSHHHAHHHQGHHGHDHHHAKPKFSLKNFAHEAGHYFKGEIIGDFAAVPLTIGVQRFFPNFMNGIRKLTEPLLGWAFRNGANRSAKHWAAEQGLSADAPEVKAHAHEMYEHEISHLPQAVVWNMFAYPIGAVAQKMGGHGRSYPEIFKSKLVGAVVSNGLLIGGRMLAPGAAQKWDAMTGEKVFLPVSKTVGKLLGVDEQAMEDATQKQRSHKNGTWKKRVGDSQKYTATNPEAAIS